MRSRMVHQTGTLRTFVIVLETGEEAMAELGAFIAGNAINAASCTAIGAFSSATLGYFDWQTKTYLHNPVDEQVEVAALTGDAALGPDGKPALHVHAVLGRRDGAAMAGHLIDGRVRPTLEVVMTELPVHLHKWVDPESHLALIWA